LSGVNCPGTPGRTSGAGPDARLMRGDRYRRNVIGICTVTERTLR
jgi:hypothetical protein